MLVRKAHTNKRKAHMHSSSKSCATPTCVNMITKLEGETQQEFDDRNYCDDRNCQQRKINRLWDVKHTSDPVVYTSTTAEGKQYINSLVASGALKTPRGFKYDTDTCSFIKVD